MNRFLNILNKEKTVRLLITDMTQAVNTAAQTHADLSKVGVAALGRTLIFNALYNGSRLKGAERSAIQVRGDGPAGSIISECDSELNVRGYVFNPDIEIDLNSAGKLDVRGFVGATGSLQVTKDLADGNMFSGQSPIVSGELGEDFAHYLAASEQINSAVAVGVLVDKIEDPKGAKNVIRAGGYIVEVLPGVTEEQLTELEQRLSSLPHFTTLLEENENLEEIAQKILGECEVVQERNVEYKCACTKENAGRAVAVLSKKEKEEIKKEYGKLEVTCNYCKKVYNY
jgi:molecular chaperone Hsp33